MEISNLVKHPAALASGVTSVVVGIVGTITQIPLVPELAAWVGTNALGLFSGVSIFAYRVAPELGLPGWLAGSLESFAIGLAIVAGLVRLRGPLADLRERI